MGVAAVDQNVARLEQGGDLLDHLIDRWASLDHHHHFPRTFQHGDQLLDGVAADDPLPLGPAGEEVIDPRQRAVVHGNRVAVALHIKHQVLTHDSQADQADIRGRCTHGRSPS